MAQAKDHWNTVYEARDEEALTWFEGEPSLSLRLIERCARPDGRVIDVGGGASRLPDALLARGYGSLAVLDLSAVALDASRERLGPDADRVRWIEADVTRWSPDGPYALWHDRAAFHFLTDPSERRAYLETMVAALETGGHAILATFADDGPETCSGLPVLRYSPEALAMEIEALAPAALSHVESQRHMHVTPKGNEQRFQVSVFRRR
jgi:SAM-dependent methyltransferase